jgi:exopolyphosphatase / guanosine-5'-triphosphate,3'-diphosphate pyrophosphatase
VKVAALDLGTNTFLCLIADVEGGKIRKIYDDQVRVVRLGQGVNQTKKFHPEALVRARQALTEFAQIIAIHKPVAVLAMATSASRDVINAEELFSIGKELGIPIEIIPGEKEAEITYRGAISGQQNSDEKMVVIDVGGGSTEIIFGEKQKLIFSESLNIGCVRLTEKFLPKQPASAQQLQALIEEVRKQVGPLAAKIKASGQIGKVLAVAGTPTELAKIEIGSFIPEKVEGYSLTIQQLASWREKFSALSPQEISAKFNVSPGREDVLLVGVVILEETAKALGQSQLVVSTRGVRFGVALEMERRGFK